MYGASHTTAKPEDNSLFRCFAHFYRFGMAETCLGAGQIC